MPALGFRGPIGLGNLTKKEGPFSITIVPSPVIVVTEFEAMGRRFKSFKEPLTRAVRDVIIPSIRQNFEEEGRPDPWEPLAEYTLKMRDQLGYASGPILDRSGKLKKAATQLARWHITTKFAEFQAFPESVFYGTIMQNGSAGSLRGYSVQEGSKKTAREGTITGAIPPRPFIMLQDEDADKIVENVFGDWVKENVRVGGFV